VKLQELQKDRDARMALELQREEKRKREKEKRGKMIAEERRLKELKRRTMDEQEELLRQEQARAMRKKEEQIQAERELRDKQAKIEAKEREEERLRKQEEHRLQTQRILDEQQSEIKARLEEMEKQEAIRLEMMERKNEQRRRAMAAKRRAIEERIERNMKMAVKIEQKRKDDFIAKTQHHEELRAEFLEAQDRDREMQRKQNELMEQRRLMVLAQTRREEEKRKEHLMERFLAEEDNVQRVREATERQQMLNREKKNLRTSMKLENVNRIKRIQEYKRLETLRRIHEGDKRIDEMMTRKADIVAARKHNALQVKIQKDQLMGMMEEAKRNGSKATKMITNFLNSQGDAGKKKGRKSGMKRSQSAPGDEPAPLGPKPDAPSLEARLAGEDTGLAPMPYVSPYETGPDPANAAAPAEPTMVTF